MSYMSLLLTRDNQQNKATEGKPRNDNRRSNGQGRKNANANANTNGNGNGPGPKPRRGRQNRKPEKQAHPGPIISVENIPEDIPDDIGNRK